MAGSLKIIEAINSYEDLLDFLRLEFHVLNRTPLVPADRNLIQMSLGKRFIGRISGYLNPSIENSPFLSTCLVVLVFIN